MVECLSWMHLINRMETENYTILPHDREKASNKVQHTFLTKNLMLECRWPTGLQEILTVTNHQEM